MLKELKVEMVRRGIKQRDLARRLEISDDLLSKYICEARTMPGELQARVARMLGRRKKDLFEG